VKKDKDFSQKRKLFNLQKIKFFSKNTGIAPELSN